MIVFAFAIILAQITSSFGEPALNVTRKCIPTSMVVGPCHECICTVDGVYHCREMPCKDENELDIEIKECEPHHFYRQDNTICSCNAVGLWISKTCKNKFKHLKSTTISKAIRFKTNINCSPNEIYIADCNICKCSPTGMIDFDFCTDRPCLKRHKGDSCTSEQTYRSSKEFCTCSDINLYIDRLCIKINDEIIQKVDKNDISNLIHVGKKWKKIDNFCNDDNSTLTINCNNCTCNEKGILNCSKKDCAEKTLRMDNTEKNILKSMPELKNRNDKCKPGVKYRHKCNSCICNETGQAICTSMICTEDITAEKPFLGLKAHVPKIPIKQKRSGNDLPDIKEGDACTPGKKYKMDCNKCHCTNNGKLLCTKMACFDPNHFKPKLRSKTGRSSDLPLVPKGPCIPGIVYQNGCNTCFCDDKENMHCGTGKCDLSKRVLYPGDIHEPFTDEEFKALETRESFSSECTPGKAYRLGCNLCLCNELKNLICDYYACLSFDEESMNRIAAFKVLGKPCKANEKFEEENSCVNCICVNGKVKCKWQSNCEDNKYKEKLKKTLELQKIDPEEDGCVPGALYRIFCNRCHCMIDAALRCTQMTCLNFAQASELKDEQEYLERNGL